MSLFMTFYIGFMKQIHGPCKIVYRPDQPHSCGATVWIETLATATMFNFDGKIEQVDSRWIK